MSLPTEGEHLYLELGECIGHGRSALVYAAKTVADSGESEDGGTSTSFKAAELCVKLAKPNHCRMLAREGWVYEQLKEGTYQGVMVPRCYGFFATDLPPNQSLDFLWSPEDDLDYLGSPDSPPRDDILCDEEGIPRIRVESSLGGREFSPWVDWRPDPNAPLLCALVMARGGPSYTLHEDHKDESNRCACLDIYFYVSIEPPLRDDINKILEDLTRNYILHEDLRSDNLIRAPADTELCRRHGYVHKWNLIDFALTNVDQPDANSDRLQAIYKLQRQGFRSSCPY